MEEIQKNDFELVNEKYFVKIASISHQYLVNKYQARWLNIKYGIKIYWCSYKEDGEEFNSYLADLGYGKNEHLIGSKMFNAFQSVFETL